MDLVHPQLVNLPKVTAAPKAVLGETLCILLYVLCPNSCFREWVHQRLINLRFLVYDICSDFDVNRIREINHGIRTTGDREQRQVVKTLRLD